MARRTALPPLPKVVHSTLGPIPVKLVKALLGDDGKPCDDLGEFDYHARVIRVVKSLERTQAHHTLHHEWAHGVLFDSGLHNILSHDLEEQLCDVFATAIVAGMLAKLNTP